MATKLATVEQRDRWVAFIVLQPLPLAVECKPWKATRSTEQNAYLWGVCYATLERETGQEAEDWHEYMLGEWAGWERYELFGRAKVRPRRRSSKLNKAEFVDFVEFIQRRAAQNGIYIPDPQ